MTATIGKLKQKENFCINIVASMDRHYLDINEKGSYKISCSGPTQCGNKKNFLNHSGGLVTATRGNEK